MTALVHGPGRDFWCQSLRLIWEYIFYGSVGWDVPPYAGLGFRVSGLGIRVGMLPPIPTVLNTDSSTPCYNLYQGPSASGEPPNLWDLNPYVARCNRQIFQVCLLPIQRNRLDPGTLVIQWYPFALFVGFRSSL